MSLSINEQIIIDNNGNFNQQGFINHLIETAKLLDGEEAESEE